MPRDLDLLSVSPEAVAFEKVHEGAIASLRLQNRSSGIVAFKLQTTAPETYNVHPNAGVLAVGAQKEIEIRMKKTRSDDVEADKFLIVAHPVDAMRALSREEWASLRGKDLQERRLQVVSRLHPNVPRLEEKAEQMVVTADTLHMTPKPLEQKYDDLLLYATDLEARLCACRGQRDELLKQVARKRGFSLPVILIVGLIVFLAARLTPLEKLDIAPGPPKVQGYGDPPAASPKSKKRKKK